MRSLMIAAVASALTLGGCSTMGAGGGAAMTPENATAYAEVAASSDLYEIQSSQLAASRARNPALRSFADMMIRDHTGTTQQLIAAATAAGIALPSPVMLPVHARMLARLEGQSGADFDSEYSRQQLLAHRQALALHGNYASRGDTPALRTVAAAAVPVVTQHLNMVRSWPR